jgi:GNAT superfamily N-acetyltransferase
MTEHCFTIHQADPAEARSRVGELADILLDCVAGGASVSFMAGLTRAEAVRFWTRVAEGAAEGQRILLVAESAGRLIGTVQVVASGTPNQPHRADLAKMLVHRDGRNKGIGAALLAHAEQEARKAGWWLMVLDTVEASAGDRLYTRAGWRRAGLIPDYALWPDGRLCGTVYFYKDLRPQPPLQIAPETPDQPEVRQFLQASEDYSAALYPPESNHMLDLSQLLDPAVRFFVARRGGVALGCGSILLGQEHGELKRFFVADAARGQGVGAGLIAAVERAAHEAGISLLRLETGVYSAPALALYRKAGFVPRTAFAPYKPDPLSVFMEKRL